MANVAVGGGDGEFDLDRDNPTILGFGDGIDFAVVIAGPEVANCGEVRLGCDSDGEHR
ncbi:hypothetical protein [Corynebacterium epidermidicanis]|uniref:Uncharacterized protein n=1 Tax=Corynebacterium epidermidicanis TaxID=1050174 RepID=A0A0G3GSY0_9CORY|nr:hypothetical protein [Corynebacterium epidermidicanis]AKK01972.1 hypothetical protein CEPID_00390 [Corynebacterium epidermidicanis]